MEHYQPHKIEQYWQQRWRESGLYDVDLHQAARPFYNLLMFPYPSAEGLHVGNVYAFTGGDIFGRFMAMRGFDVFEPIGFDAFGIHSENFAIQQGEHPAALTARNVARFREQLRRIGNRFDWRHEVDTTSPDYYRWTQWIFVQLFKAGLAVRKTAPVNWCPTDQTVLADEQVIDGRCERCDSLVVQRELEQWFLRITAYADRLLDNLDGLDWSNVVKTAQRRWIGRERGAPDGAHQKTTYRLRDWLISRQRYWGTPIPVVYCPVDGIVAVPEHELPVVLPVLEDWMPRATGASPLAELEAFVNTTCPTCGGPARRETDVADNFLDSAWFFLRYPSAHDSTAPFDPQLTRKWLPVDMYVGGAEHSVLHLLYSRFINMALHDLGFAPSEEPFQRFRAHGLLTLNGSKMSKSRGNVVNPDEYLDGYGADVLRLFLMFIGPFDQVAEFNDRAIGGVQRFVHRVWRLVIAAAAGEHDPVALNELVEHVASDVEQLRFNTAIAAMMGYVHGRAALSTEEANVLVRLLAPFTPHVCEELWSRLGQPYSVHQQAYPQADTAHTAARSVRLAVQVNGRTRGMVEVAADASRETVLAAAGRLVGEQARHAARVIFVPGRVLNIVLDAPAPVPGKGGS